MALLTVVMVVSDVTFDDGAGVTAWPLHAIDGSAVSTGGVVVNYYWG